MKCYSRCSVPIICTLKMVRMENPGRFGSSFIGSYRKASIIENFSWVTNRNVKLWHLEK